MTLEPPKATKLDSVHTISKALLSTIPMLGGPAAELFQWLIQPPLERRRGEWIQQVTDKLNDNQGIDLAALRENERFITAVLHATQIALRTHQIEKREALRNAVINVALDLSSEEALEHIFFEWIDSFSVLHLRVLKVADNPALPKHMLIDDVLVALEQHMPQFIGRNDLYLQLWNDLSSRGLIKDQALGSLEPCARHTTMLGRQFLDFISEFDTSSTC